MRRHQWGEWSPLLDGSGSVRTCAFCDWTKTSHIGPKGGVYFTYSRSGAKYGFATRSPTCRARTKGLASGAWIRRSKHDEWVAKVKQEHATELAALGEYHRKRLERAVAVAREGRQLLVLASPAVQALAKRMTGPRCNRALYFALTGDLASATRDEGPKFSLDGGDLCGRPLNGYTSVDLLDGTRFSVQLVYDQPSDPLEEPKDSNERTNGAPS